MTSLLVAGASVAVVAGFLASLPGIGTAAIKRLMASPEWPNLIELPGPRGSANRPVVVQHLLNLQRRAAYLIMAGRRLGTAVVRDGGTPGTVAQALRAEGRYLQQHLRAVRKRNDAAAEVAAASIRYGQDLGWHAIRDDRTSPECRAAHGSNFRADEPPAIGYPGAVHEHCRCKPGPPFNTDRHVNRTLVGAIDMSSDHSSATHPDLPNKPGKSNWVEKTGGLPSYIKRVAKHIMADSGLAEGHAIAAAHNWCVRQAAAGNAQAAAAIAEWNAKAAAARAS